MSLNIPQSEWKRSLVSVVAPLDEFFEPFAAELPGPGVSKIPEVPLSFHEAYRRWKAYFLVQAHLIEHIVGGKSK